MSRIGKQPIHVANDVKVEVKDSLVTISKGKNIFTHEIPSNISVEFKDNVINVTRANDDRKARSLHGLIRKNIANTVIGLTTPFKKVLNIKGIGFKSQVTGKNLVLNVGYSHAVNFPIPDGINIEVDAKTNQVTITGENKCLVGETAAKIRDVRPPEPYKATGIAYIDERIIRKAGKAASAGKK